MRKGGVARKAVIASRPDYTKCVNLAIDTFEKAIASEKVDQLDGCMFGAKAKRSEDCHPFKVNCAVVFARMTCWRMLMSAHQPGVD